MLVVLALLGYAALLGGVGGLLLTRARWAARHPWAALRLWHTLAVGFFLSVVAALVVTAHDLWEHAVVWVFHAGKPQVHSAYAGAWHIEGVADAAVLTLLLAAGTSGVVTARRFAAARREQERARLVADALGTADRIGGDTEVRVLEHASPTAFCVPGVGGDGGRIVVSRGAVERLTTPQLEAAVAHEQAHLRLRHHRSILLADAVTAAVGWSGFLRGYGPQVQRLAEMAADDHAARLHGRRPVAAALLEMCIVVPDGGAPGALAMTGPDPAERIRRLITDGAAPAGRLRRGILSGAAVLLLAAPLGISLTPAALVADTAHCGKLCARR
ncbi:MULTISPECIES: M56 family metallopeptidase [Streptomyces]|uniref:M56 family metallopeptidase n=1 Tax=Streptomyces TaxID=1883 RepID=UPI0033E30606